MSDLLDDLAGLQARVGALERERERITALEARAFALENPAALVWTAPTLLNSWANLDLANYPPAGYLMDRSGFVHLRGRLNGGTSGTVAFTLPVGFRPVHAEDMGIAAFSSVPLAAVVEVGTGGNVSIFYAAGAGSVMLSGASYDTRA